MIAPGQARRLKAKGIPALIRASLEQAPGNHWLLTHSPPGALSAGELEVDADVGGTAGSVKTNYLFVFLIESVFQAAIEA